MKSIIQTLPLCGLAFSSLAFATDYTARNVEKSDLISGVYSITVKQTGTTPTVRVVSDGKKYTAIAPNQSIQWQASSRGVCRSLRKIRQYTWWINDNTKVGPNSFHQHHVKLKDKKWITSKHSDDKYESAGSIVMPVNTALANAAVASCNAKLNAEANGENAVKAFLSKDHTIYSSNNDPKLAGVVYMRCSGNNGMNTKHAHAWQNIRVNYKCEGFDFPKPKPAGMTKFKAPFALENPKVAVTPTPYNGSCPVDLNVNATIKANEGQTKVKYRWSHNNGMGPVATTTLNTNGWKSVNTVLKDIGKPKGQGGKQLNFNNNQGQQQPNQFQLKANAGINGIIKLLVLPESENNWAKAKVGSANYTVNCKTASKGKIVMPAPTKKADLVPGPTLTIHNATANWGSVLNVDASNAQGAKRGDRCRLRFAYSVKNQGQGNAGQFFSRLFEGNTQHNQSPIPKLDTGESKTVSGHIFLNDGQHVIGVFVDNKKDINESNELNNMARITVNVKNCDNDSADRPRPGTPGTPPRPKPAQHKPGSSSSLR